MLQTGMMPARHLYRPRLAGSSNPASRIPAPCCFLPHALGGLRSRRNAGGTNRNHASSHFVPPASTVLMQFVFPTVTPRQSLVQSGKQDLSGTGPTGHPDSRGRLYRNRQRRYGVAKLWTMRRNPTACRHKPAGCRLSFGLERTASGMHHALITILRRGDLKAIARR